MTELLEFGIDGSSKKGGWMKTVLQRATLHREIPGAVWEFLAQQGTVERKIVARHGFDCLVGGWLRVSFKVASKTTKTKKIKDMNGGVREYHYPGYFFNFQAHTLRQDKNHLFVCILADTEDFFCIPGFAITGKTFACIEQNPGGYRGCYQKYRGNWQGFQEACAAYITIATP